MRSAILRLTLGVVLFSACKVAAYGWLEPIIFTNKVAITNGHKLISFILSADSQSKSNIQELIGAEVVLFTHAGPKGTNCMLTLQGNFVLLVEFSPPYEWPPDVIGHPPNNHEYPSWFFHSSEVFGLLKSVDLEKRFVTIVARQADWKVREPW